MLLREKCHLSCVKLRRLEGGFATLRERDGHSRKDVFQTFDVHVGRES